MTLNKPQRIATVSSAATLLAGVGSAVGAADWKYGLYGLLVATLAGVSGVLWPTTPPQPFTATSSGPAFLNPIVTPVPSPETPQSSG